MGAVYIPCLEMSHSSSLKMRGGTPAQEMGLARRHNPEGITYLLYGMPPEKKPGVMGTYEKNQWSLSLGHGMIYISYRGSFSLERSRRIMNEKR